MLFLVVLFPVSNLVKVIGTIMAERVVYLPSAGFAGCVVLGVFALAERVGTRRASYWAAGLLSLAVAGLGIRTYFRNFDWADDVTLWTSAIRVSPDSFKPYHGLAQTLSRIGESRVGEAIEVEKKAVAILDPLLPEHSSSLPYGVLGLLWLQRADMVDKIHPEEGRAAYQQALEVLQRAVPIDAAYNNYKREQDLKRGVPAEFIQDIGIESLYINLSEAWMHLGHLPEAVEARMHAVGLNPMDDRVYAAIAELYQRMGRRQEALRWAAEAFLIGQHPEELDLFVRCYWQLYPKGCAPVTEEVSKSLNMGCPLAQAAICEAEHAVLQHFEDTHWPQHIEVYRKRRITGIACGLEVEPGDQ